MAESSNGGQTPSSVGILDVQSHFNSLVSQWQTESQYMSSMTDMIMLPSYQRIIGIGREAVPLLLRQLEREPDYWFWALQAITGDDPVQAADRGDLRKMAAAWLSWGRHEGYRW